MGTPDSKTGLDQKLLDRAYDELDGTDVEAMWKSFQLIITELMKDKEYNPIPTITKLLVNRLLMALGEKGFEVLYDPVECKEVINGLIRNLVEDDVFKPLSGNKK